MFVANDFNSYRQDAEYRALTEAMQTGDWDKALGMVDRLEARYPNETDLQRLRMDISRRQRFQAQTPTVRSRRSLSPLARRVLTFGVVILLALGLFLYSRVSIQPALDVAGAERQAVDALTTAQAMAERDQFPTAAALLTVSAQRWPTAKPTPALVADTLNAVATTQAQATAYPIAVTLEARGQLSQALSLFSALAERSLPYKDSNLRASALGTRVALQEMLDQADVAYEAANWQAAREAYEALMQRDKLFERQRVAERLGITYRQLAQGLLNGEANDESAYDQADDLLSKAASLRPTDTAIATLRRLVQQYNSGLSAMNQGNVFSAISRWRAAYDTDPSFLNGHLAERLYQAYLEQGTAQQSRKELDKAYATFQTAAALKVADTSEARRSVEFLRSRVQPTATRPPTRTPTATPRKF